MLDLDIGRSERWQERKQQAATLRKKAWQEKMQHPNLRDLAAALRLPRLHPLKMIQGEHGYVGDPASIWRRSEQLGNLSWRRKACHGYR